MSDADVVQQTLKCNLEMHLHGGRVGGEDEVENPRPMLERVRRGPAKVSGRSRKATRIFKKLLRKREEQFSTVRTQHTRFGWHCVCRSFCESA